MNRSVLRLVLAAALVLGASPLAFAQGGSATLSGSVVDTDGGAVPGATVVVKNNATGVTLNAVTNSVGAYSFPSVDVGTYTVTVTLQGFKTAVHNDIRLLADSPVSLKTTLEIGARTETIEVKGGGSELVQTQSTAITSTISAEQIRTLPLVSRNALYFVTFLPGVETTGGPRGSTLMGLPQSTISITIDGISNSNLFQSGDGFFSLVTPRVDAVEEITVTGATNSSNSAGTGAVNIAFVTRQGTNAYDGSFYHYIRHPKLNSNYFFNKVNGLDRNRVIVNQYGGRVGGPIVLPGMDGRGKAFFFFNMEHFYQPTEVTRTRTVLNPQAQTGTFTYIAGGTTRSVDVLSLAASNNQLATIDPTVAAVLAKINAAMGTAGKLTTPENATNTQSYVFQAPSKGNQYAPTGRVDFNLTPNQRLTGTAYYQRFHSSPDILNSTEPRWPGFTNFGIQASHRTTGSITLRSTLSSNLVNEAKGGWQWSPVDFFGNINAGMFTDFNGLAWDWPLGLTDPFARTDRQPRNTVNWNIDNTLSWLRGNHSFTLGGSFTQVTHNQHVENVAPTIVFGFDTNNDPARLMFNTTNFPGASTGQLNDARNLYALLTGRITQINGTRRLNAAGTEYVYLGDLFTRSRMNDLGLFIQDSWRVNPTLTLNYGVRYQVQFPFTPLSGNFTTATIADLCGVSGAGSGPDGRFCNLFQPGNIAAPTVVPQYVQYSAGSRGYNTDYNNVAPNVGVAWRPNVQSGFLRTLLGDPEQATLRAGYSIAFNRPRMDEFTGLFGGNPGGAINSNRNAGAGFPIVLPGESWPVLLRQPERLGPPAFDKTPAFPILASINAGNDINIFDPKIEIQYTESWQVGLQRAIGRDTAIEVRYVGNRNMKDWTTENWNDLNIFENGFLEEFKAAQQNLLANLAAGRGATFAYTGIPGTSPLPTYLAFFSGVPFANANNPALYTSSNFSNSAWTGHLGVYEPDPFDAANDLWNASSTFRNNALNAGVPRNWFVLNPHVDDANVTVSKAGSRYHSLQIDIRRRLAQGFQVQGNYTFAKRSGSSLQDLHLPRFYLSSDNVPHAYKFQGIWEIPVGHGKRYLSDMNPILNGVLGNWEFSGTGRVQVREFFFSGVQIVGMSEKELRNAVQVRIVRDAAGAVTVWALPQDIIDNTRRAFNTDPSSPTGYSADGPPTGRYLAPASGPGCVFLFPGDCGAPRQISMPSTWFSRVDLRLNKRFPFGRKASVELTVEMLNAFDNINFSFQDGNTRILSPGGGSNTFRIQNAYTDINTTFDPGGRIGQIIWRVNW